MTNYIGFGFLGVLVLAALMYWGTFNSFQKRDENVGSSERKIASCYQKRADLFMNAEATVKEAAKNETGALERITAARAQVGQMKLPENATPDQIKAFVESQASTGSALQRLLAVAENYPTIQSNQNFLQLQKDVKETEQQCNVLRNKYIESVKSYNVAIRSFPSNLVANIHGYTAKEQIKFENEAQNRNTPQLFKKTN